MLRKTFSGLILIVLLTGILTSTFNIQPVEASGIIYIRFDGRIDPPTAPITTTDIVTYTFTGNIDDSIVVERNNIIIDGADCTLQGTETGRGIDLSYRSNVTIINTNIKNFRCGVYLGYSSSNNMVSGNNITNNNWYGVFLYSSSNNMVSGNNITNNGYGVYLSYSSNNTVSANNITNNNWYGVHLYYSSSNNMVSGNTFINTGVCVLDSYGNVVEDNTVNGKPLVYLEEVQEYTVGDAGQVILVNCNNITVENLNLSNTDNGIQLWNTNNCSITGNNITNNLDGVFLSFSSNNDISGNNITNNTWCGVVLVYSSNNMVSGNNITNNEYDGVYLYSSSNNMVSGNNITNNNDDGVFLHSSSNNNTFYHNNFVGNTEQIDSNSENIWDNGCEGNYWSNYDGSDLDGDGIGDTFLPWESVDQYPLMNPYWLPGDVDHDLKIDIYDVVRITGVYGSQQGDPNWNCHSDIAEPYGIINIYDVVTCTGQYGKEYTP